jgi:hypothetical protein
LDGGLVEALMDRPYRWYATSTPLAIAIVKALALALELARAR